MINIDVSALNYRRMQCREILATAYPSQDFNLSFSGCSKGLTLPKERFGPCPWLLDGNLEAPGRSFQIRVSLFTCGLGPHQIVNANKSDLSGGLGSQGISSTSRGWRPRSTRQAGRDAMWQTSNENPGHPGSGELLVLAVLHASCQTSLLENASTGHTAPLGADNWKLHTWSLSALLHAPPPLADFNLYPFTVINCTLNNSFSEFHESFQQIVQPKGGLGDLLNCRVPQYKFVVWLNYS